MPAKPSLPPVKRSRLKPLTLEARVAPQDQMHPGSATEQGISLGEIPRPQVNVASRIRCDAPTSSTPTSYFCAREPTWAKLTDEALLDQRICKLGLDFENTHLVQAREQLYTELQARGIQLKPVCWLSDDWFSPDDVPGIAVPFYMAHPRLMRLERKLMFQVEGGTRAWCMQILRHEAGHAIDTAFQLYRQQEYRLTFGDYFSHYPSEYRPSPRSREFVRHLDSWYAQAHPSEDFAETFAVWLKPRSNWRQNYQGWGALEKLKRLDVMMGRLVDAKPLVRSRAKIDPVRQIKKTLRQHYAERHALYRFDRPSMFDASLSKIFNRTSPSLPNRSAGVFLIRHQCALSRQAVAKTGESRYNIDQVIRKLVERCRVLKLKLPSTGPNEHALKQSLLNLITEQAITYLGHRPTIPL